MPGESPAKTKQPIWPGVLGWPSGARSQAEKNSSQAAIPDDEVTGASHLSTRQSLLSLGLIAIIFILLGFTSGSMEVLNAHFAKTLSLAKAQSGGLQASFYAAYLVGPLTYSNWILHRFGFRWNLVAGLSLFALGCLGFLPSTHYTSFGGFCGSCFFIGSGFATMDVSLFPYVSICGPPRYSEIRTNIAFAIQSTCQVMGLISSSYWVLGPVQHKSLTPHEALAPLKWIYLGLACFASLAIIFTILWKFHEVTDADMDEQAKMMSANTVIGWEEKPLIKHTHFWVAFVSMFCYCGAQSSLATYFISYVTQVKPGYGQAEAARLLAIAGAAFAVLRISAAFLMKFVKPRLLLLWSLLATAMILGASMGARGEAGLALICMEFAAKACIFPTMFSLALKGLGRHTKTGSAFLITAQVGGGFFAPATGALSDAIGTQLALCIPLSGIVVASLYGVSVNLGSRRKQLDGVRASTLGLTGERRKAREISGATTSTFTSGRSEDSEGDGVKDDEDRDKNGLV